MHEKLHALGNFIRHYLYDFGSLLAFVLAHRVHIRLREKGEVFLTKEMDMEKAYDIKALVEKFKGHGLELVEEEAKQIVGSVCEWLDESGKISATPYDDMAFAVALPKVKELALGLADKINPAD